MPDSDARGLLTFDAGELLPIWTSEATVKEFLSVQPLDPNADIRWEVYRTDDDLRKFRATLVAARDWGAEAVVVDCVVDRALADPNGTTPEPVVYLDMIIQSLDDAITDLAD
jgi:hypothetical protein